MSDDDKGSYHVSEEDYDTFLKLVHDHIFGRNPRASSLLERHREVGPLLIDLDLRYEIGGPLLRRFTADHVRDFISEYVAAMIYFSCVEKLEDDLVFYHLEKPSPESDKTHHKDGVHIQCPSITTTPKYQYGIRGFLLSRGIVDSVFKETGVCNPPEDVYDVSVIHRNNWFLYGACKPNKPQYRVVRTWRVPISEVEEALDGGDPVDYDELVEIVKGILVEEKQPTDTFETMKMLSIRRGHTDATPLGIRNLRAAEWEELMINWGGGKSKLDRPLPPRTPAINDGDDALIVAADEGVESRRVTSASTAEDIALAYRLCRECLNAERRAGEYQDWVNLAICLKNIATSEESFKVWCELTRRVNSEHKKARMSDAELRTKWNLIRIDNTRKLRMGSLTLWAREDNPEKYRSIMSETHTEWIVNFAKDTHVNVASFVCRLFEHEFRCSIGSRKGAYEWYQYVPGGHAWRHMRTATELRARLSGRVKNEYVEAGKKLADRHNATTEDAERERIDEKRKKLFGIERQLEMSSFKDNVLRECQEKFYDEEFLQKLNTNGYILGVANGVLELRHYDNEAMSGRPRVCFREGLPDDNISFQMGRSDPDLDAIPYIPYDPNMVEQKELSGFFARIYPDPVLREYVLTLLSSCLEGANKEQRFYVMQGVGSNGKSMIEILMEKTFGDYGTSMSTTVMTRKRPDSSAANPDIITVKCKRYIHMGEPDDNEKINTSVMKQYTGGDRVPARGLFSDQEKILISGKIFMSCNDLPPVSKMDNGTWRRLRVIPHVSIFKDPGDASIDPSRNIYEKDLDLENKLTHWRTAFLSLLVHYYDTRYLVHGLKEPDCVTAASNKYKEDQDKFMEFFNDNFVKEAGAGPLTQKDVRTAFADWKKTPEHRNCDLKVQQIYERMLAMSDTGSTLKEFWGVRHAEETDASGNLLANMP